MIRSLEQLRSPAANSRPSRIAVAVAQDAEVLLAVDAARRLGLAIARSFTELQGGTFEVAIDGDLFKVTVTFPVSH